MSNPHGGRVCFPALGSSSSNGFNYEQTFDGNSMESSGTPFTAAGESSFVHNGWDNIDYEFNQNENQAANFGFTIPSWFNKLTDSIIIDLYTWLRGPDSADAVNWILYTDSISPGSSFTPTLVGQNWSRTYTTGIIYKDTFNMLATGDILSGDVACVLLNRTTDNQTRPLYLSLAHIRVFR